jgi:hypothetical protein
LQQSRATRQICRSSAVNTKMNTTAGVAHPQTPHSAWSPACSTTEM